MSDNKERNNKFADSLEMVTADELSDKKRRKRNFSESIFNNLRYLLIIICTAALVYSGFSIAGALSGYADQEEEYNKAENMMDESVGVQIMLNSPNMPLTPDYDASQNLTGDDIEQFLPQQVNKEFERIRIKLANIKSQYPDLYGWITIPGTVINYPIMQTDDNDYYLDHSYTGTSLGAGSIFADYQCKPKLMDNKNLVIYGHHMSNNSMFYSLDLYLKDSFFKSNNTIYIYTLDGMYTYKVFSVYETHKYFPYIRTFFASNAHFADFATMVKSHSIHNNDAFEVNGDSRILTLSTCTNRSEDGRLAVHALLTEIYESKKDN